MNQRENEMLIILLKNAQMKPQIHKAKDEKDAMRIRKQMYRLMNKNNMIFPVRVAVEGNTLRIGENT